LLLIIIFIDLIRNKNDIKNIKNNFFFLNKYLYNTIKKIIISPIIVKENNAKRFNFP
jgi:hypothetical protein